MPAENEDNPQGGLPKPESDPDFKRAVGKLLSTPPKPHDGESKRPLKASRAKSPD